MTSQKGCLRFFLDLIGISTSSNNYDVLPYSQKQSFLTKAEANFFHILKKVADENYHIFAQVRMADLLVVNKQKDRSERAKWFNKISAKHIDFVICDSATVEVLFCIELDDSSHNRKDREERDHFLNQAFQDAGLQLLRVKVKRSYKIEEIEALFNHNAMLKR